MAASANVFDTRPASPHSAIARVRAAAIDVGSNSVHLVVAEPDGNGSLRIVAREKEALLKHQWVPVPKGR